MEIVRFFLSFLFVEYAKWEMGGQFFKLGETGEMYIDKMEALHWTWDNLLY